MYLGSSSVMWLDWLWALALLESEKETRWEMYLESL